MVIVTILSSFNETEKTNKRVIGPKGFNSLLLE